MLRPSPRTRTATGGRVTTMAYEGGIDDFVRLRGWLCGCGHPYYSHIWSGHRCTVIRCACETFERDDIEALLEGL